MMVGVIFLVSAYSIASNPPADQGDRVVNYIAKSHLLDPYRGNSSITPQVTVCSLGGNEREIALVADTTFHDRSGYSWNLLELGHENLGKIDENVNTYLWSRCSDLFIAHFTGPYRRFVALNADVCSGDGVRTIAQGEKAGRGDVLVSIDSNNLWRGKILRNGLDDGLRNPGFERLERVRPEVYRGFELKRQSHGEYQDGPRGKKYLNVQFAPPGDFQSFACQYRKEIKRCLGLTRLVTVFAVFFDADNDGDVDFYVSSDAESRGEKRYHWTLFLTDSRGYERAKSRVFLNQGTVHDVAMLEPQDVAGRDAFYRVVRTFGASQILVMEFDGKRLHSHAYTHLLTDDERHSRPSVNLDPDKKEKMCLEAWEDRVEGRLGYKLPKDLRDQVSWPYFHSLERLPCLDYPEE